MARFKFNRGYKSDIATELEKHAYYMLAGKFDGVENAPFWMRAGAVEIKRLQTYIRLKELEDWHP